MRLMATHCETLPLLPSLPHLTAAGKGKNKADID